MKPTPAFGLTLLACLMAIMPAAQADDLDRAFGAQRKPAKNETRVERSVGEATQAGREGVVTRAEEREQALRRDASRALERDAPATPARRGTTPAESHAPAPTAANFVCRFRCTNANLLGADKNKMSIRVTAPDARAATDRAARDADAACLAQVRRVLESGSVTCTKL